MRADEKALAEYVLRQIAHECEEGSVVHRAQLIGACRVLGALTGQDYNDLVDRTLNDVERVRLIKQAVERDAIRREAHSE